MDIIRDSTIGLIVRFATRSRCLLYPEELPDFVIPSTETEQNRAQDAVPSSWALDTLQSSNSTMGMNLSDLDITTQYPPRPLRRISSQNTLPTSNANHQAVLSQQIDETSHLPNREKDIIVDWYGSLDPENPQNWSTFKKTVVTAILWLYTFTVYCASAIYTPSVEAVMEEHHVSHSASLLGLSLYVFGYGFGPLLFSPISEMSHVGRNKPYILTLILYVLLSVPTALVHSFPAFLVLRFLTGFLGSPCLATGGATLQDMYSSTKLPYGYTAWVGATFCAPALGPVISAFVITKHTWRWSMWEVLWLALFTLLIMILLFPETSSATILYRRARRTRQHFQDRRYRSRIEIDEAGLSLQEAFIEALLRPLQITALDPAVFFTNLYSSYSYGVYYSFFEAFPIVYTDIYGFSLGLTGTAFISIVVACLVGTIIYLGYVYCYLEPKLKRHGPGRHEERLIPAIFASFLQPIGLFLFAWSSRTEVHWIVSITGIALFSTGGFILFQGIFMYLPLSYPRYAASLFAANDLFRSVWAGGAILYATPLFKALGIARGVSLLGGLSCGGVLGVIALYFFGAKLRSRSKFADF